MKPTPARPTPKRRPLLHALPANDQGRDFIVGDLHGMRALLDEQLARVDFSPEKGDRLIAVGDLVDRGPEPMGCLRLLREPWFHAVLGNHERILLAGLGHPERLLMKFYSLHYSRWTRQLSSDDRHELLHDLVPRLLELPLVLKVGDGPERYYVVHAGRAHGKHLINDEAMDAAHQGDGSAVHRWMEALTWSRRLAYEALTKHTGRGRHGAWEEGVSLTYVGHTVIHRPLLHRSHLFLDRGGVWSGKPDRKKGAFELLLWEHGSTVPRAPHYGRRRRGDAASDAGADVSPSTSRRR